MSLLNSRLSILASRLTPTRCGFWLLLGWLAFWLGTVAYPCQAHPAPAHLPDQNVTFEGAAGLIADHPDSHSTHDERTCHHLSEPVIGASFAAAADSGNPNVEPAAAAVTAEPAPSPAANSALRIHPISQSPPHTPLYLRTRRLLI